jgi:DNA polymerase-4
LDRHILHIRLDAFFATVEQRRRPNLRSKPVIVTEPKGNISGIVTSASREARKLGINEGDSVRQAQRMCPEVVQFRSDYTAYRLVFGEFLDILAQFTPLLEPDGLGSAYMDVTASEALFGEPSQICARIISEVSARLDMPLLIGCAPNKLLAKIASGRGKWFVRVRPGGEAAFLDALPVSALDVVTNKLARRLDELGVTKIGELVRIGEPVLVRQFGPAGSVIHKQAAGIDYSPVAAGYPAEAIAVEHTFSYPLEEPAEVEAYIKPLSADLVGRLREKNILAGEIMLDLEGQPAYFKFKTPTCSTYTITQALNKLLKSIMKPGMEVSKLRAELSELTAGEGFQLSLIGENERGNRLNRVIETLVDRFGEGAVFFAGGLRPT